MYAVKFENILCLKNSWCSNYVKILYISFWPPRRRKIDHLCHLTSCYSCSLCFQLFKNKSLLFFYLKFISIKFYSPGPRVFLLAWSVVLVIVYFIKQLIDALCPLICTHTHTHIKIKLDWNIYCFYVSEIIT